MREHQREARPQSSPGCGAACVTPVPAKGQQPAGMARLARHPCQPPRPQCCPLYRQLGLVLPDPSLCGQDWAASRAEELELRGQSRHPTLLARMGPKGKPAFCSTPIPVLNFCGSRWGTADNSAPAQSHPRPQQPREEEPSAPFRRGRQGPRLRSAAPTTRSRPLETHICGQSPHTQPSDTPQALSDPAEAPAREEPLPGCLTSTCLGP